MYRSLIIFAVLFTALLITFTIGSTPNHGAVDTENNDFAEFEEGDEESAIMDTEPVVDPPKADPKKEGRTVIEPPSKAEIEDDDEIAQLSDEDEFEFGPEQVESEMKPKESTGPQSLKFADVPAHFRSNWASYQVEALVLIALMLYLINYGIGRAKNQALAHAWFSEHQEILEQQFAIVGDDGVSQEPTRAQVIKDTDCSFSIWCSGRVGCLGMLIQLKLLKRQDLIGVLLNLFRPSSDKVIIRVELEQNEMDSFVLAFGQRKSLVKLVKAVEDLSAYATEKKGSERFGLPPSFAIFSEISEASSALIDPTVTNVIKKYESAIDYVHVSDQYSGAKLPEGETLTKLPDISRIVMFSFNLNGSIDEMESRALMNLVFYMLEKIRRYRMSREGKSKAEKKRQAVADAFLKTTHQQRQEAAQARREEKTRERKQRLMEEEDPEKQRRLEKMEQKRDAKAKQPKMKQLKVK